MSVYFTSDNHYYHNNIIKLANRPFKDLEEMHKTMIDNWNKVVRDIDTVYIVGDFVLGTSKKNKVFSQLKGNKVLIKGNHDSFRSSSLLACFIDILDKGVEVVHDPKDSSSKITIHGHEHNSGKKFKKQKNGRMFINVNVEFWNYTPVSEKQIIELLKENGVRFNDKRKSKI